MEAMEFETRLGNYAKSLAGDEIEHMELHSTEMEGCGVVSVHVYHTATYVESSNSHTSSLRAFDIGDLFGDDKTARQTTKQLQIQTLWIFSCYIRRLVQKYLENLRIRYIHIQNFIH